MLSWHEGGLTLDDGPISHIAYFKQGIAVDWYRWNQPLFFRTMIKYRLA